jgi:hypothetical protein
MKRYDMRKEYDFSQGTRGRHAGKRLKIVGDPGLTPDTGQRAKPQVRNKNLSDVTKRILETTEVIVSWLFEDTEAFLYNSVPGSIVANSDARSLRFELTEKNGDDENFEAVIKPQNGSYVLKADHPEIQNQEFPLKVYLSSDEVVLYLENANNRAYLHLR